MAASRASLATGATETRATKRVRCRPRSASAEWATDLSAGNGDALRSQPPGLLRLVPGDEPAGGRDHSPPGKPLTLGQDIAHGPGSPRVPGFLGHLSVRGHIAGPEPGDHRPHSTLELRHVHTTVRMMGRRGGAKPGNVCTRTSVGFGWMGMGHVVVAAMRERWGEQWKTGT